jgi:SAM-dependent methyltransferase
MRTLTETPANRTRRSRSIPRKLVAEGALHLLPVYYLLRLSDLAREGIEHSGSCRFADHIYRARPSGRTAVGRWLDGRLLAMPAARAFRRRYQMAADLLEGSALRRPAAAGPLRVLAVPCGLPRDVVDAASRLAMTDPAALERIEYHGLDIDPDVIAQAGRMLCRRGLGSAQCHVGNAFNPGHYPAGPFHIVISAGLGDFLDDHDLEVLYRLVHRVLAPGGTFFTSASARDRRSDVLLRLAEIVPHYREASDVEQIVRRFAWTRVEIATDESGLQTFVTAVK